MILPRQSATERILGPLGGMIVIAFLFGLWFTWITRPQTESELIAIYAGENQRETGNDVTDCFGRPADVDTLRLYVICKPEQGAVQVFLIDEAGWRVSIPSLEAILKEQA